MPEEAAKRTQRIFTKSPKLKDEILAAAHAGQLPMLAELGLDPGQLEAALTGRKVSSRGARGLTGRRPSGGLEGLRRSELPPGRITDGVFEAIVRVVGRPPLLVKNGTYEKPPTESLRRQLEPHRKRIDKVVASIGRIEFRFHQMPWGGTGWMIDENIVVTNRHVAELVAESDRRGGFRFRNSAIGKPYIARIDYREEHGGAVSREAQLVRVKFLAALDQPDIALFEVESPEGFKLPPPIELGSSDSIVAGLDIGVVGYPADDPERNDPDRIAKYFGHIFDVKRFAAGEIIQTPDDGVIMHDATTLGGNSGSAVFDLATGRAVGLHFAGEYKLGNFAVDADTIKRVLRGLKTVVRGADLPETEKRDSSHPASFFKGRDGYQEAFLGASHKAPLPGLGALAKDVAEATEGDGTKTKVLRYRHFSVVYSKSRKLPILTAVNIDGEQSRKVKRGDDQWFRDLRLPHGLQLGEKDYGRNVIDRGHMVRREDPVWGTPETAVEANFDTFHYTNAAPQHADLNQRTTAWLGLENFILENSRTKGLKVAVFTGPVLRKDDKSDPDFPGLGPIPREFWKVVAAIDAETNKLYATGFVLTQGKMIADFTEAIVFGDWNSFQVPIAQISKATGLDFKVLEAVDTIGAKPGKPPKPPKGGKPKKGKPKPKPRGFEGPGVTGAAILLNSPSDIFLG